MGGWFKAALPRDHFSSSPIQPGDKYPQESQTSLNQWIKVVTVGEILLLHQQFLVGEVQTSQVMAPREAGSFLLVSEKASDLQISNLIVESHSAMCRQKFCDGLKWNLCADSHSAFLP